MTEERMDVEIVDDNNSWMMPRHLINSHIPKAIAKDGRWQYRNRPLWQDTPQFPSPEHG